MRYHSGSVPLLDQQLERILAADGWPCERLDDTTWRSWFTVEQQKFRFFVRLTPSWVFLTIIPFVPLPTENRRMPLYQKVLELNRTITLAKFAVDKDDLVLTVELPTEHIVESQLKDGLDALSFYAGTHYAEVAALAAPLASA